MQVIRKIYIVCNQTRTYTREIENANFLNTGMALVGILNQGETIDQFKIRQKEIAIRAEERVRKSINKFKLKEYGRY